MTSASVRRSRILGCFLAIALLLLSACTGEARQARHPVPLIASTGDAQKADGNVTVDGGALVGPDDVTLVVPPGAVEAPTSAYIRTLSEGYDVHIDGPWTGKCVRRFPVERHPERHGARGCARDD